MSPSHQSTSPAPFALLNSPRALAWITVLLWAFGAVGGKIMSVHSGSALFLVSTLCTFLTFQFGARLSTGRWVQIVPRDFVTSAAIVSSLGYGWYWLWYGGSFRHSPVPALSAALNYTWPLFTAIFSSIFFAERRESATPLVRAVRLTGMGLGAVAVALVLFSVTTPSEINLPWMAVLLGLAAGAAYGFYSAFSSTIEAAAQFRFLVLSSLSGMIVLFPFAVPELPSLLEVPRATLAVTILFGILMDGIGYFVWTRSLSESRRQGIPVEKVTSIIYVLPVLSVVLTQAIFPSDAVSIPLGLSGVILLALSTLLCQRPGTALRLLNVRHQPE